MRLVFAIVAALCALTRPQDKIELKFKPKQGDRLKSSQKMSMKIDAKANVGGQEQNIAFEQRSSDKRTREYAQVTDGKPTKVVLDVEEDVEESKPPGAEDFQRKENPLHGKKVTLTLKDGQTAIEGIEDPDKKTKKSLKLEDEFSKTFPKNPVSVGDSWDVTGKDLQELLNDESLEGKVTLKLSEVKEIDGRKCAVLAASLDVKGKTEEGVEVAMKLTGDVVVWVERGYTLSAKLKGTVKMKMENDQMTMAGEGPMTMEVEAKP